MTTVCVDERVNIMVLVFMLQPSDQRQVSREEASGRQPRHWRETCYLLYLYYNINTHVWLPLPRPDHNCIHSILFSVMHVICSKDDNHPKMKANVKVWLSDVCTGVLQEIMSQVAFISTSGFA